MKKDLTIEEIIRDYSDDVRAIAKKFYISDGSTDDLFQEGLIGLSQGYNTYDKTHGEIGCSAFKSFVLMCARRQIIDAVKRSNSKRNLPMTNFVSLSAENFIETPELNNGMMEPFEEQIINKVSNEESNSIIVGLSEFEREVLDFYLDGFKQSEIATILNKTIKSIDNTLQRIKTKLKRNI